MNCDICHNDTNAGTRVSKGLRFEVHICPNCLMWSDDPRAVTAREIVNKFRVLREKEDVSIDNE